MEKVYIVAYASKVMSEIFAVCLSLEKAQEVKRELERQMCSTGASAVNPFYILEREVCV